MIAAASMPDAGEWADRPNEDHVDSRALRLFASKNGERTEGYARTNPAKNAFSGQGWCISVNQCKRPTTHAIYPIK
jgi:hypothetical protein